MKKLIILLLLSSPFMGIGQIDSTYFHKCENILKHYPKAKVTASMLYNSALRVYEETSIEVPYDLALVQCLFETDFGSTGVGKTRNNPYSINSSKGYRRFDTMEEGVYAYYSLISRKYLQCRTKEQLLQNFVNCSRRRYAGESWYEGVLRKQLKKWERYERN